MPPCPVAWVIPIALLFASQLAAQTTSQIAIDRRAASAFTYRGSPIHPFCTSFPVDSARTQPLDLSRCTDTKAVPTVDDRGWIRADYVGDNARGSAGYRVLAMKGTRFLVASEYWGGGTGHFTYLQWLRLEGERITIDAEEGEGDRCEGGLFSYSVTGTVVLYSVQLTPPALVRLARSADASVLPTGSYVTCAAAANYRYDLATETRELTSVDLERDVNASSGGANLDAVDACFERIVQRYRDRGQTKLSRAALAGFASAFDAECASAAAH